MQKTTWLGLAYSVPINPSKARVYVWRKLKEFGAEYLKQGMAVLPYSTHNSQQFTVLAQKIRQMGGEALLVELRFTDPKDEAEMVERFQKQMEEEYQALRSDCINAANSLRTQEQPPGSKESEQIKQRIKRYRKAKARDYFKIAIASEIEDGINEIIDTMRELAGDVGAQLKRLMEA